MPLIQRISFGVRINASEPHISQQQWLLRHWLPWRKPMGPNGRFPNKVRHPFWLVILHGVGSQKANSAMKIRESIK